MRPAKGKSVDNGRTDNAFALTARRDNNQLHPGCRYALPWAMCFCAYSATVTETNITQGVATLCPGLCAFAPTARDYLQAVNLIAE